MICKSAGTALVLLTLGGCSAMNPLEWWSGGPSEYAPQRYAGAVHYQCDDRRQLFVRYAPQGQNSAMVILPDREFRLDQAPGTSGTRYTNGRTTLIARDAGVVLEEDGAVLFGGCKRAGQGPDSK